MARQRVTCGGCFVKLALPGKTRCAMCHADSHAWRDSEYRRNAELVKQRDSHCALCGQYVPDGEKSVDHIVRRRDGGSNKIWNLQLTHAKCNSSKQ